ncbi:hypothetical protein C1701_22400 [Actinoalloteichus sp. AHMU CJ021]|uniref:hypothetical protein n=1 Tax=Actinoalloteichus sp. AHMU CJ021 TaxID=2072503 RepID=UPI000412653F|nr:hypothetical protein C1701_22400 [Actinoalloteichus sp. AHMU CJ021]
MSARPGRFLSWSGMVLVGALCTLVGLAAPAAARPGAGGTGPAGGVSHALRADPANQHERTGPRATRTGSGGPVPARAAFAAFAAFAHQAVGETGPTRDPAVLDGGAPLLGRAPFTAHLPRLSPPRVPARPGADGMSTGRGPPGVARH